MTLYRLVRLVETHSHELALCLLNRVRNSEATPDYQLVPDETSRAGSTKFIAIWAIG